MNESILRISALASKNGQRNKNAHFYIKLIFFLVHFLGSMFTIKVSVKPQDSLFAPFNQGCSHLAMTLRSLVWRPKASLAKLQ